MIKNNLSKIMGEKRLTHAKLSRLSGLNITVIFKLYHDKNKQIEFETINKLCKALKCSIQDLFEYVEDVE